MLVLSRGVERDPADAHDERGSADRKPDVCEGGEHLGAILRVLRALEGGVFDCVVVRTPGEQAGDAGAEDQGGAETRDDPGSRCWSICRRRS